MQVSASSSNPLVVLVALMILQLWSLLLCVSCSEASSPALLNRPAVSRAGTLTVQHTTLLIKGSQPLLLNKIQQDQSLWLPFSCRARPLESSWQCETVWRACLSPLPCLWPGQIKGLRNKHGQNPSFLKLQVMHFFLVAVPSGSPYISWGKNLIVVLIT